MPNQYQPQLPVDQQYQTDDQFYDVQNGGKFQGDEEADQINAELDRMLNGDSGQGGQGGFGGQGGQGGQGGVSPEFKLYLDEQQQYRQQEDEYRRNQRAREDQDRQAQQRQLDAENARKQAEATITGYRPQFQEIPLTEEQRAGYATADPYIRNMVQTMLGEMWDNNLTPALSEHQRSIMDLSQRPTQVNLSVDQQVSLSNPDVNQLVADPAFQRYLAEPVEGTGMTRREIMDTAYKSGNVASITTMLGTFRTGKDQARPQRSASPSATIGSAPQGGQGAQQRVRPYSELTNAQQRFRMGQITREQYNQIENSFEVLATKQLVDYNK